MSYESFVTWKNTATEQPLYSVVIPAYNEQERILPTLASIAIYMCGLGQPWELIVSDDGSRDATADMLESLGWQNLRVIRHANTGKGGAVKRGVLAARGQWILFTDADNSTPIEEFERLLAAQAPVAIASRHGLGANEANKSPIRKVVSGALRLMLKVLAGIPVRDTQCGFKLFRKDAAHVLFQSQRILGFSFDLELLYLAHKKGFAIAEIPVQWFDAPGSKVNALRDSWRFIQDIYQIRLFDHQGLYQNPKGA